MNYVIVTVLECIISTIYIFQLNKKIQKLEKEYKDLDDLYKDLDELYDSSLDDMNAAEDQVKIKEKQLKKQIKYNANLKKKLNFSKKEVEELYAGWTKNWTRSDTEISPDSVHDIYQDKYKNLFVNIPNEYHSFVTKYNDYIGDDVPIEWHNEIITSRTKYRKMKD